jgi:hypothetical protein
LIEDPTTSRKLALIQQLNNRGAHSPTAAGVVESGVDFEKRIVANDPKCRTPEQISFEFDRESKPLVSD